MHARDQNLFLYAVAVVDTKVIVIPGVDEFTSPFLFPVHVISGTGEQSDGARNDYLSRIVRAYAETHNRNMYGYMVTR